MQNAPAMLAQKMMNRQAPYGPIGMVAQNMSGNKKGAAGRAAAYMSVSASVVPVPSGAYDVYIFNASGTLTVNTLGTDPVDGGAIEYLVIAGGGGAQSGGGGSGAVNCGNPSNCANGTILIIAAGGNGGAGGAGAVYIFTW